MGSWSAFISVKAVVGTSSSQIERSRDVRRKCLQSRQRRKQLQNLMGRIDPVRSSSVLLLVKIVSRLIIVIALASSSRSFAVEQPSDIPAWLRPNVGEGEGQIAEVILRGARALLPKSARGRGQKSLLLCHGRYASPRIKRRQIGAAVLRYLRIRPVVSGDFGGPWRRPQFERYRGFRQRKALREELRQCAGFETDGRWAYVTAETKTSFKGYYRASAKQDAVLIRSFVQFDGEGEVANARH